MRISTVVVLSNLGSVALATVELYYQCGGSAYTGDSECIDGASCSPINDWYSQCVPSSGYENATPGTPIVSQPTPAFAQIVNEDFSSSDDGDNSVNTPVASATPTSGSGSGSTDVTGITRTLPQSSGAVASASAISVSGTFDGKMYQYDRSPSVCTEGELGEDAAMFILEDGATLQNVIIGPNQGEGVHCLGTCTLINVWWEDVCEDAVTLKQSSGTSVISGGGAFHASDKVVQFNGRGTVEISNFYVEDYGKLSRSCGNCDGNGGPRNVVIDNVAAVNGGELCGINTNYGDTCTITNACQDSGKSCGLYTGNDTGAEPTKNSDGADGQYCVVSSFSETC